MEKLVGHKINKIIDTNLIGVLEITYSDEQSNFNTIYLPGVMIESLLVFIPNHPVLNIIENSSNTIVRFHLTFTEFNRKYFVDSIEQDEIASYQFLSDLESNGECVWKIIMLKYNIGNFLQKSNVIYYSLENLNDKPKRGNKFVFANIYRESDSDVKISYSIVKEYFVFDDKVYLNFDFKNVINGILLSEDKKIVGVYSEKRNRLIRLEDLEKMIIEKSDRDTDLLDKFNKNFKNNLSEDSILMEVNQMTFHDLKTFSSCLKNYTKEIIVMNSADSTLSSYFNHFNKYFFTWQRVKTLISVGPNLIIKLCKQFKINPKTINYFFLIQMIITENKIHLDESDEIRKYLDLSYLTLDSTHFTSVIYSFFNENLVYIDLTNIKFDSYITKILSNFLYRNNSLCNLILERTDIEYSQLFDIVSSIRQSKNKTFSNLNLSHNTFNFDEEILESEYTLDSPGPFMFSIELCKIPSLKNLIMTDIFPQSHLLKIFKLMKEFILNSRSKLNESLENKAGISLNSINLSNNKFSKTLSPCVTDYILPLSNFLNLNNSLEEIYLPNCDLGNEEIKLLLQSLVKTKNIYYYPGDNQAINYVKILDLSGNFITAKGAVYIKNFLKELKTKEKIYNRKFSESGEGSFSDSKEENCVQVLNSSIDGFKNQNDGNDQEFSLFLNNIPKLEPGGLSIICEGITGRSIHLNLHVDNIKIKKESLDALYNIIKLGNPIKTLSIAKNNLNDFDIDSNFVKIFSNLNNTCSLTTLDIHGNNFSIETLFNLLNITQKYSQHKNLKPCKIICDPINFSFLKNSNKDKFQSELTEENILNTNPDGFEENIKLIKNLFFSYKKSKIKNKTKNKNKN